jgi:AcrR family transcriptional regulator
MTTPARPLRRDAERNRQRILAAAGELFADRGLSVTLDDIARHAGVGVGTVYRRFPDKDLLIDALFEERLKTLCDAAEAALAVDDAWEGLVLFLERGGALQADDRGLKELVGSGTYGGESVVRARDRLRELVTELFDRAKAAGVVREEAVAFDAPLIFMMLGAVMDRTRDVAPDVWRRYLGLILDGLRPDAAQPLPHPPLDVAQVDAVMRGQRR